jgi:hypothetical protein
MLVVTEELQSTDGRAIKGSITWELTRQDITTNPLGSDDLLQLQGLVNSLVNVLQPAGLVLADVSYAAYFPTQSTVDSLNTVKQISIAPYAQAFEQSITVGADLASANASQYLPIITTVLTTGADTVFENFSSLLISTQEMAGLTAVGLNTCVGLIAAVSDPSFPLNATATAAATFAVVGPFCTSTIVKGGVKIPYYSSTTNPATD